jgi:hypothetical protein
MPDSPLPDGVFDELRRALAADGPTAAADRLVETLRTAGNYEALFYALLLRTRLRLGADPIPTRPADELPPELHTPYEEAIRDALDAVRLHVDDEVFPLIEIALHHGVHPRKGFDLVLDRQGICNAITLFSGFEAALAPDVRAYCVRRLVESLHDQLRERLIAEVRQHDNVEPATEATVPQLIDGRDWLFGDDAYLVDVSHLGAVVQSAVYLPPGDAGLAKAIELCDYGAKLSPKMRFPGEPPFEDLYADHAAYLRILAGEYVETGLEHFRTKAGSADPEQTGTRPAEVYVNLLLLTGHPAEATAAARELLVDVEERSLGCPGPLELARRQGDFTAFADVARRRGDAVHFLAGLLAAGKPVNPE